jgi:hypothetical protein
VAFHFDYDGAKSAWFDDKGKGIEAISYLESYLREMAGLTVKL